MKNLFKPFLTAVVAFLLFVGMNQAQAQIFHVETSIPGCVLDAKIGYGPTTPGCNVTVWTTETVVNGDNFYAIPPGLEVKVFYVQNPMNTGNTGFITTYCGPNDTDVADCSGGTYNVSPFQGPYSIFDEYVMIYP